MRLCTVDGCGRPYRCSGLCDNHYRRQRRNGNPGPPDLLKAGKGWTLEQRFWRLTDRRGDDECWPWKGAVNPLWGYARIGNGEDSTMAHRFAYELLVGPIPAGLQIDHLCRNPRCQNPRHMEPVTPAEHNIRTHGAKNSRTHCPQGHPFDDENTYIIPSSGSQACRTCVRERQRRYQQRQIEKAAERLLAGGWTPMT